MALDLSAARPQRKRSRIDYAALEETGADAYLGTHVPVLRGASSGSQGDVHEQSPFFTEHGRQHNEQEDSQPQRSSMTPTSKWVPYLLNRKTFAAAETVVQFVASGADVTEGWARRTGLKRPTIVRDASGLGLTVPKSKSFGVREVARVIGEATPVQVMNTADQSEVPGFSLGDWASYFEGRRVPFANGATIKFLSRVVYYPFENYGLAQVATLNVISLEFSKTKLADKVRSPAIVRSLDWIDTAWPKSLRDKGESPQTRYYCLMSAAGCYTDFHVDFGGTAVWYHVVKGRKVFLLIAPTPERLAAYERWICSKTQDDEFFADRLNDDEATAKVELLAGQTLIIPSAWIHAVYTPDDSLVFGGNFLPGLPTLRAQLDVHGVETRARVPSKFRFPYFVSAMFFGLAATLERLRRGKETTRLTSGERDGLEALLDACEIWARGLDDKAGEHAKLAAEDAGCDDPDHLVRETRRLFREAYASVPDDDDDVPPGEETKKKKKKKLVTLKLKTQTHGLTLGRAVVDSDDPTSTTTSSSSSTGGLVKGERRREAASEGDEATAGEHSLGDHSPRHTAGPPTPKKPVLKIPAAWVAPASGPPGGSDGGGGPASTTAASSGSSSQPAKAAKPPPGANTGNSNPRKADGSTAISRLKAKLGKASKRR